jgi:hypothetical protein
MPPVRCDDRISMVRVVALVASAVIGTTQISGEVGRNISFPACRRKTNRLDEWLPLYRLTAVSCVIGEAHVAIIDKPFIQEHPVASGWRSRQYGSW